MCSLECTAEEQYQVIADESYDKGLSQGFSQGQINTTDFFAWLFSNNRVDDAKKASSDKTYFDNLYKEYQSQVNKK